MVISGYNFCLLKQNQALGLCVKQQSNLDKNSISFMVLYQVLR